MLNKLSRNCRKGNSIRILNIIENLLLRKHALLEENTFENLDKMNTFNGKYDLPKLSLEDMKNPKRKNCKIYQLSILLQ